jgi:DNA invertase Pin-like site-specific DNA recombinase
VFNYNFLLVGGVVVARMKKEVKRKVEKKIYQRFFNDGETNIAKLARELKISRNTVYCVLKKHPEKYERAIHQARMKTAIRRKRQQNNVAQKVMQKKAKTPKHILAYGIGQHKNAIYLNLLRVLQLPDV